MVKQKEGGKLWTNEELRKLFSACGMGDYITKDEAMARGYIVARWARDLGLSKDSLSKQMKIFEDKGLATREKVRVRYGNKKFTLDALKLSDDARMWICGQP